MGHKIEANDVLKQKPDVLIIATGSKPVIPNVPGINNNHVVTAHDILSGKAVVEGNRVVVVGAGQTGCETGELLAERGYQVMLIDQLPPDRLAPEAIPDHRNPLIARLNTLGVKIHTEQRLKEIGNQSLVVTTLTGEEQVFEADTVILAMGTIPVRGIAEQTSGKVAEIYVVGDSAGYHRIVDAIYWGAITASRI